jgi:hypothetical protein
MEAIERKEPALVLQAQESRWNDQSVGSVAGAVVCFTEHL